MGVLIVLVNIAPRAPRDTIIFANFNQVKLDKILIKSDTDLYTHSDVQGKLRTNSETSKLIFRINLGLWLLL